jgi:hypothetical protein
MSQLKHPQHQSLLVKAMMIPLFLPQKLSGRRKEGESVKRSRAYNAVVVSTLSFSIYV